jgi:O-acetyl-ADP-ribose deacetylase (regulator of RNase III)
MNVVEGDLIKLALNGSFDVIVHGANCQCTMGAGIAKAIKSEFPEAFQADLRTTKGDSSKLGTISTAEVVRSGRALTIVNAYTQLNYRGPKVRVDYDAIRDAMREVRRRFGEKRIGYPRIGAGLGGGDWDRISSIIDAELAGTDHTLVEFRP